MFKSYIKLALRNLWKRKTKTGINILSLSAGIVIAFGTIAFKTIRASMANPVESLRAD